LHHSFPASFSCLLCFAAARLVIWAQALPSASWQAAVLSSSCCVRLFMLGLVLGLAFGCKAFVLASIPPSCLFVFLFYRLISLQSFLPVSYSCYLRGQAIFQSFFTQRWLALKLLASFWFAPFGFALGSLKGIRLRRFWEGYEKFKKPRR
jgi:hypothetical protein